METANQKAAKAAWESWFCRERERVTFAAEAYLPASTVWASTTRQSHVEAGSKPLSPEFPDEPKKKGQPHAELAGTGPELCGKEEAR